MTRFSMMHLGVPLIPEKRVIRAFAAWLLETSWTIAIPNGPFPIGRRIHKNPYILVTRHWAKPAGFLIHGR